MDRRAREIDGEALPLLHIRIPRNPFDAGAELKKIRVTLPREGSASKEVHSEMMQKQNKLRRERLVQYKEALSIQEEALGSVIHELRAMIAENPDHNAQELMDRVNTAAEHGRFTHAMLTVFSIACHEYERLHSVIKKYDRRYKKDPAALFEQCFGFAPRGRVELIARPLVILFAVHDENDYVRAFAHDVMEGKRIPSGTKKDALESGGVFFQGEDAIFAQELKKHVGLVKAHEHAQQGDTHDAISAVTVEELERNSGIYFPLYSIESVTISDKKDLHLALEIAQSAQRGHLGTRMTFLRDGKPFVELVGVRESAHGRVYETHPFDQEMNGGWEFERDKKLLREQWKIRAAPYDDMVGQIVSSLNFSPLVTVDEEQRKTTIPLSIFITLGGNVMGVMNPLRHKLTITSRYKLQPQTSDATGVDPIIKHEEEHAWNKLFVPVENAHFAARLVAHAAELFNYYHQPSYTAQERIRKAAGVRREILMEYARWQRREMGIDLRARDELLAYWKDGRSSMEIKDLLTAWIYKTDDPRKQNEEEKPSNLYNYRWKYRHKIKDIPSKFNHSLLEFYRNVRAWKKEQNTQWKMLKGILPVNPSWNTFRPIVKEVFEGEYGRLVEKACDTLVAIARKGYSRDETCALLAPVPLAGWRAFERRLAIKSKMLE